jgi:hypothetical protein
MTINSRVSEENEPIKQRAMEYTSGSSVSELEHRVQHIITSYGADGFAVYEDTFKAIWEDSDAKTRCELENVFSYDSNESWTEVRLQQLPASEDSGSWERLFVFRSAGDRDNPTLQLEVRRAEELYWSHGNGWRAKNDVPGGRPTEYELAELDVYLTQINYELGRSKRLRASRKLGPRATEEWSLQTSEFNFFMAGTTEN